MFTYDKVRYKRFFSALFLALFLGSFLGIFIDSISALATSTEDLLAEAEERKNEPVQTNAIEGWPQGPAIGAKAAVLMDANSGTILYGKNMNERLYPASTTKMLTCILVSEHCNMDELVTISQTAIDNRGRNGSNMALIAGEQLTVEELLYGVLINSANEACNALAEHISGDIDSFMVLMNEKAVELGCTDTHFTTPHGYHDDNHYTTAHDMALIGKAFAEHEELCRISLELSYHIEDTDGHNHEEHYLSSHNRMLPGCSYHYEGLVASKTGFTDKARQTLVSIAEVDGLRLVCVILKEESPDQFLDTDNLFAYGFNNFTSYKITDYENRFLVGHTDFFNSSADLFGSTLPLLSVKDTSSVLLPNSANFADTETSLSYESLDENDNSTVAHIIYSYHGAYVGDGKIVYSGTSTDDINFSSETPLEAQEKEEVAKPIFVNVKKIFIVVLITAFVVALALLVLTRIRAYLMSPTRPKNISKKRGTTRREALHRTSRGHNPKKPTGPPAKPESTGRRKPKKPESVDAIRARKEAELLAARRASQAEIKARQDALKKNASGTKKVQLVTNQTASMRTSSMQTSSIQTTSMRTSNAPKTSAARQTEVVNKRPVQQITRTSSGSFADRYRVGVPDKKE